MDVEARSGGEPDPQLCMFVCGVIVDDQVYVQVVWNRRIDPLEKNRETSDGGRGDCSR
jgi:hypothetical protein